MLLCWSDDSGPISSKKKNRDNGICFRFRMFNDYILNWFLPKNSKKKKRVRLYILAYLGDSLEKYTTSHITIGNGTCISRWGHLIHIKSAQNDIPSCQRL